VLADLVDPNLADAVLARAAAHPLLWAATNLMYGCAGYGLSRLRLWQLTGAEEHLEEARRVGAQLAATAIRDGRGARWPARDGLDPDEKAQIGYAYGGSGVALFLLYLHHATGEEATFDLGRAALDFELAARVRIGTRACGYPRAFTEGPIEPGVVRNYWDEGTAGVTTVALRYLLSRPDPELLQRVRGDLEDSCRKYAVLPQLFHGLAGLGNVLLDAYELTGDGRYLDEAWRTAEGVLLFRVERAEGVVFPGEQALRECTDFATGSAGIGLFLHRLTQARPGGRTNFNFVLDDLLPAGIVPLRS
jgi:lantibiotic modifying enzyme